MIRLNPFQLPGGVLEMDLILLSILENLKNTFKALLLFRHK
jgi:hypothetical protein